MTDSLRTRIAEVLHRQYGPSLGAHPDGWEREPGGTQDEYLADADAVIRELGLRRDPISPHIAALLFGNEGASKHRYVTEWKADE